MRTLLALYLSVLALAAGNLQAFYSVAEMDADSLRKDPYIRIRVRKSGEQITFIVALRARADRQEVYWHGSLDVVDPQGVLLSRVEMRGEEIRRSIDDSTLREWGWQDFRPGEVFRFTVEARMLTQSKFTRETGPRNDEHGITYGGGIIRWSYLQALADAAENAHKIGAVTRGHETAWLAQWNGGRASALF
jgi:hypothetical protein